MGDIVVGHGENGELCDGSVASVDTTRSLVNGTQIGVHITRVTTSTYVKDVCMKRVC